MRRDDNTPPPLSRPMNVARLAPGEDSVTVEATSAECDALAADFRIPGIRDLSGRFAVDGPTRCLRVTGTVTGTVTLVCTVSLEPFEAQVSEPVEVVFTDTDQLAGTDADIPDPIVGGRIDFGVLTAEFLALGIPAYPRRPGIAFEPVRAGEDAKPFDALRKLRPDEP
ncbi:YceD family protein [uncultured Methylobacterium sp.]|uniref:YceD family protein n=1 Tax=uncultured Methylobacterium sp. TaxID=157278 RepID=UPI0035CAD33B